MKIITVNKNNRMFAIGQKADMVNYVKIIEDYLGYNEPAGRPSFTEYFADGVNAIKVDQLAREYVQADMSEALANIAFADCEVALVEDGKRTVFNEESKAKFVEDFLKSFRL